jgi:hypothetical protein
MQGPPQERHGFRGAGTAWLRQLRSQSVPLPGNDERDDQDRTEFAYRRGREEQGSELGLESAGVPQWRYQQSSRSRRQGDRHTHMTSGVSQHR